MAKKEEIEDIRTCSMCIHATDWHCLNNNGKPFMCRCKFFKWSRFLYKNMDVCANFKPQTIYVEQLRKLKLI